MWIMITDHPLDPENSYLSHTGVAALEMLNVYSGTVSLDEHGAAVVELPLWFEALNRDVRYQPTAIGAPAPNLHIAQEMRNNHFTIAGGKPNMKVSWQVIAACNDPYAAAHGLKSEAMKPPHERSRYLHPQEYGQPVTTGRGRGESSAAAGCSVEDEDADVAAVLRQDRPASIPVTTRIFAARRSSRLS